MTYLPMNEKSAATVAKVVSAPTLEFPFTSKVSGRYAGPLSKLKVHLFFSNDFDIPVLQGDRPKFIQGIVDIFREAYGSRKRCGALSETSADRERRVEKQKIRVGCILDIVQCVNGHVSCGNLFLTLPRTDAI